MSAAAAPAGATGGRLGALCLVVFINLFGFGVVLPVLPFFGRLVGATPTGITLAMAAYSLGQLVGAPFWGRLSDRIGRRPVLLWSTAGLAVSYAVMALAQDVVTLGVIRLFGGMMAGNIAAAFSYVGDVAAPADRPKAMGLIGAAFGMGFIFGPAVGGIVAGERPDLVDFNHICLLGMALTAAAALAVWRLVPESLPAERRHAQRQGPTLRLAPLFAAKPAVPTLMAITLIVIASASLMEATIAFLASDRFGWGPLAVGLAFGFIGTIASILQVTLSARLARRLGSATVLMLAIACYGGGVALMGIAGSSATLVASMAFAAIGVGLFTPAFQTLVADASDDRDRGLINGLTQGSSSLGRVIGPAVAGVLYQAWGTSAPFLTGGAVMTLAIALTATIRRGEGA